ncbi:hypothetical protein PG985_010693 [Apiospora marii]|uniref:Uncharacterized protein n=1 Tax=Apiospora marii TaxID=335849 RepID=A0ABR1T1M9_9PEZI
MIITTVEKLTGDSLNNIVSNASKAAAASLAEGLRLEPGPLGDEVVNLLPGGVESTVDNAPAVMLTPGSLYNVTKKAVTWADSVPRIRRTGSGGAGTYRSSGLKIAVPIRTPALPSG